MCGVSKGQGEILRNRKEIRKGKGSRASKRGKDYTTGRRRNIITAYGGGRNHEKNHLKEEKEKKLEIAE